MDDAPERIWVECDRAMTMAEILDMRRLNVTPILDTEYVEYVRAGIHDALKERADALACVVEMVSNQIHSGDDSPDSTFADFNGSQTDMVFSALDAYRNGEDGQ